MAYLSDIEIAQRCKPEHIGVIAKRAHVDEKYIEQYGNYKAKIDLSLLSETKRENGKLILVTAITPTPAGEGKTTTTIGLADGLRRIGKDVTVALQFPLSDVQCHFQYMRYFVAGYDNRLSGFGESLVQTNGCVEAICR